MMEMLGDHIKLIGGGTPSKANEDYWDGDIPWASVKDLKSDILLETIDSITKDGVKNSATKIVPAGTILIATRMAVGKVTIPMMDVAINQDLKAIFCDKSIDNKFLFYLLKSKENYFDRVSSGATVKGIKINHITDLEIPLPPLPTQKKIAAILDAADAYRQKTKALIAKYDELTQSLFLDMFGDPVTNPKGWKKKSFTEVFGVTTGKLDSNQAVEGGQYPFFTCAKDISSIDRYSFDQEALMLAGNNAAGVYDVKYYYGKFNAYQRTYVLTLNEGVNYQFFRFHLERKLKELQKVSIGSGTKYLTMKILDRIMLLCPNGEDQNIFTSRVKTIEAQKAQAQQSLEKAEELFNALLQRAFKGELV